MACLSDLVEIFASPGMTFRETLAEIESYPHDPEYKYGWRSDRGERTMTHPHVRRQVSRMLAKEEKDFSGVMSAATAPLSVYDDPLLAANLSASDFSVADLVRHERPISLYIVIPPSDKLRLRPLVRLMLTVIVNRLTERMDFQGTERKANRHRLLFMIDEFPSLERIPVFADALSYMAGYGMKAFLIAQDIRQIIAEYGPNESIVSNCHVRCAFAPNQLETAELLSKMTGTCTVQRATFNFSGPRLAPVADHVTTSVEHVQRPLMTPDEVSRIRPPKKKGRGQNERIVAPGDMLIFVSGCHPIYGRQMLYFKDPVLSKRAAIPPPEEFEAVEEDRVVAQKPLDRTPHVISKAETVPPERESPMERALWLTLERRFQRSNGPDGFIEDLSLDRERRQ